MAKWAVIFATISSMLSASGPLHAQGSVDFAHNANWLVGYVMNAPQQLLGGSAWAIPSTAHRWGLYADVKITADSPAGDVLDRSMTPADAEELGDTFFKEDAAWTSANLAVVRGISPDLAIYVGGGISWRTTYVQYLDDTQTRGRFGQYWVVDDDLTDIHPNVLAGALFRASSRWVFQFGAEAAPAGATVGAHLRLR